MCGYCECLFDSYTHHCLLLYLHFKQLAKSFRGIFWLSNNHMSCVECLKLVALNTNIFLTLFLRALFFFSLSRVNAGNAVTSSLSMAAWMMLQSLGSSSWEQHRAEAVMASMSPWCCTYSWITSCRSSSEPLYFFSNSRMSCTVI